MRYESPEICRVKVNLTFKTPAMLNIWKGGAIRGAIGESLKDLFCTRKKSKSCYKCKNIIHCPYGYLYESRAPPGAAHLSKMHGITKPYVIEPPLESKTDYLPGEEFSFYINLFGRGIRFWNQVKTAIENISAIGKGRNRDYGKISSVSFSFLDLKTKKYINGQTSFRIQKVEPVKDKVTLDLISPTLLIFKDAAVLSPSPSHILKSISRKYTSIMEFHENKVLPIDWPQLFKDFDCAVLLSSSLRHSTIRRWGGRLSKKQMFPAIQGRLIFDISEVENKEFVSFLLSLGEYTHIGKFATFGAGMYRYSYS